MNFHIEIVGQSAYDISKLASIGQQGLGYNPASNVDQGKPRCSHAEKVTSILAAMLDKDATPDLYPNLTSWFNVAIVAVVEESDLMNLVGFFSGTDLMVLTTVRERVMMLIVNGTLNKWHDAIIGGTNSKFYNVQTFFCKLHGLFVDNGWDLWKTFITKPAGHLYLLEHKNG